MRCLKRKPVRESNIPEYIPENIISVRPPRTVADITRLCKDLSVDDWNPKWPDLLDRKYIGKGSQIVIDTLVARFATQLYAGTIGKELPEGFMCEASDSDDYYEINHWLEDYEEWEEEIFYEVGCDKGTFRLSLGEPNRRKGSEIYSVYQDVWEINLPDPIRSSTLADYLLGVLNIVVSMKDRAVRSALEICKKSAWYRG